MFSCEFRQQSRAQTETKLSRCKRNLGDEPFAVDLLLLDPFQSASVKLEAKTNNSVAEQLFVSFTEDFTFATLDRVL